MIKDGAARGLSSVEVISDTRIFASTSLECCGIVPFAVRGLWMLDAWTGQCGCAEDGSDERTCMHACMRLAPLSFLESIQIPRVPPQPHTLNNSIDSIDAWARRGVYRPIEWACCWRR